MPAPELQTARNDVRVALDAYEETRQSLSYMDLRGATTDPNQDSASWKEQSAFIAGWVIEARQTQDALANLRAKVSALWMLMERP